MSRIETTLYPVIVATGVMAVCAALAALMVCLEADTARGRRWSAVALCVSIVVGLGCAAGLAWMTWEPPRVEAPHETRGGGAP